MTTLEVSTESPKPKKAKLDESLNNTESIHDNIKDLSSFKLKRILQNNTNRKTVYLSGTFESKKGDAVVILEKAAFAEENLNNNSDYFTEKSYLEKVFQNDIYGDYKYFPKVELNAIKTTIIYPATEKHIVKFSTQKCYIVDETPQIYNDIILPYLTLEQLSLQWVYNILDHKSEVERIVFEDVDPNTGFVLVPDLKWNGDVDTLYLLAIVKKHNIKSLRDLTQEHLPLLRNIKEKGIGAIESKYGLDGSQLRIYLHYQPSFYHLHVHFCYLKHEAPGILAEKAHLLSNVISNIELLPDYYQKSTLPFVVRENDNLFKALENKEVRPRLQSVNVFVSLLKKEESINVVLDEEQIQIIDSDTVSTIPCEGISIVPDSLASLKIADKYLTFRFATNNSLSENLGGFKTEFLRNTVASIESLSNKPLLSKGTSYIIQCINCSKPLSNPTEFQRILPLPSDSADLSDWYCHAHSNGNVDLDPKDTDIFYTHCYVHIHKSNILNIKGNNKIIVCKSCLSWLGIIHNSDTLRIWLNTVKFLDNNTYISTRSLKDVFHSIKDILKHSLHSSVRLMLNCQTSSNQIDSVLIWILEKKLQILFDGSGMFKKYDVAKVLFNFVKNDNQTFAQWQNDSLVNTINVSKPMIVDVLKHLHKFNKVLPQEFSKSNDYYISYLFMYEPFLE